MHPFEQHLKTVYDKMQVLIKQHQQLQKENERLKEEIDASQKNYQAILEKANQWEQQAEILKFSKGVMSDGERAAFEKRLSQYVKEIDRCIALLHE